MVGRLNRMLRGWANYFSLGPVSRAYRAVDRHAREPAPPVVVSEAQGVGTGNHTLSPDEYLYDRLGLVELQAATAQLPVGETRDILVREPDAGNPPVRFDEREVETEHGWASEAPANERAGNR